MDPKTREALHALSYRSVLVTASSIEGARFVVSAFAGQDIQITVTESFRHAKALIGSSRPDVLVTDLRLGEYNGLHLVLRGTAVHPDMATLVLADVADQVLMTEADRLGATFVVKPLSHHELLAAVVRTLHRRGSEPPIRPPFERRFSDRRSGNAPSWDRPERRATDRRLAVYSSC